MSDIAGLWTNRHLLDVVALGALVAEYPQILPHCIGAFDVVGEWHVGWGWLVGTGVPPSPVEGGVG